MMNLMRCSRALVSHVFGVVVVAGLLMGSGCATELDQQVYGDPSGDVTEKARVLVPNPVEVTSVDGKPAKRNLLLPMRERYDLVLEPGPHHIMARLRAGYDLSDDDHAVVYSRTHLLKFDAKADGRYQIRYTPPRAEPEGGEEPLDVEIWIEELPDDD